MKQLTPSEREDLLVNLLAQQQAGIITEGELLRKLRKDILGMNQEQYAKLVKISRRTLSDVEKSSGNQTISLLNRVFRPLGLNFSLRQL